MVCGAPTPRSSGGRSAVITIRGTNAWEASATQGWSSAAAVPLVTTMATGTFVTSARPSAKKPALRSSIRTWTRSSPRDAHASASGVERDPGHNTTSRSPNRIHSSNNVAAYVACTSLGLGTLCDNVAPRWPTSRLGPTPRVAARLHADQGLGTSVSLHSGRNERASHSRPAGTRGECGNCGVARRDRRTARRGSSTRPIYLGWLLLRGSCGVAFRASLSPTFEGVGVTRRLARYLRPDRT